MVVKSPAWTPTTTARRLNALTTWLPSSLASPAPSSLYINCPNCSIAIPSNHHFHGAHGISSFPSLLPHRSSHLKCRCSGWSRQLPSHDGGSGVARDDVVCGSGFSGRQGERRSKRRRRRRWPEVVVLATWGALWTLLYLVWSTIGEQNSMSGWLGEILLYTRLL